MLLMILVHMIIIFVQVYNKIINIYLCFCKQLISMINCVNFMKCEYIVI